MPDQWAFCWWVAEDESGVSVRGVSLQPGDIVHVRQRRWVVESSRAPVNAGDSSLVDLACVDDDAQGQRLSVLWANEPDARKLEGDEWAALGNKGFDEPEVFAAYFNTKRWNCVTATDPRLFQAPFRAGIRIEAYQLAPLRLALALPRVNLFIADDVGLGKTIEAGLIARELLLRRRIDTIVVAVPPSTLLQWQEELESRFGLAFVIMDREFIAQCRRERGYGVNPWSTHSRFLISSRLLVDEAYVSGMRDWLGEIRPRSLLILDEAHHAAPSGGQKYAIDSQITRQVRELAKRFEHRLFLSATPHNGHSNSFSALLEILDPTRFCRGVPVRQSDLKSVMVRRLKDDIREIEGGFPKREVIAVEIDNLPTDTPELLLASKLDAYRELREQRLAESSPAIQRQGRLAIVTLQHRLLSSIEAFARTVGVHRRSMERIAAQPAKPKRAGTKILKKVLSPVDADDDDAVAEPEAVEQAAELALIEATEASILPSDTHDSLKPELALLGELESLAQRHCDHDDARVERFLTWIDTNLCPGLLKSKPGSLPKWNRRRVIVFTEWEDTRRYLERRLRAAIENTEESSERIATYTGSTPSDKREAIKHAFNLDPDNNPIRILIATDAAREGLNLQRHCADLFHFDLPWNPARLEQRNGRIDRKLQSEPTVRCHYFIYKQRPEDRVLKALVRKSEQIRKELGSIGKILDHKATGYLESGIRRRDIDLLTASIESADADPGIEAARRELEEQEADAARVDRVRREVDELRSALSRSQRRAGVSREHLKQALDAGLALSGGKPLRLKRKAGKDSPDLYEIPFAESGLGSDTSWIAAVDMLRERKPKEQSISEWRRRAIVRPIALEDAGAIGEGAVQLHLEHRIVRRVLGRFVSKGLVDYDLSRACLAIASDSIPKAILVARLSLYGVGGARLHEELLEVTARWVDPRDRKGTLQPYARDAEQRTLEQLDQALLARRKAAPEPVIQRLLASSKRDIAELTPHLEARAKLSLQEAEAKLKERAAIEGRGMEQTLREQAKRIEKRISEMAQLNLGFTPEEKRQVESDRRHLSSRLNRLAEDLRNEPARVEENYAVKAWRLEPVGLAYLWPETG